MAGEVKNMIAVDGLRFSYTDRPLLSDLSFEVPEGRFLAIAGPNGAGKSTLVNLICRLLKPQAGIIRIDGREIGDYSTAQIARKVSVVRQEFVPVFGYTVLETVLMARTPYYGRFGFEQAEDRRIAAEALAATGTEDLAMRPLAEISGGERQRVFIARALAQQTPVLLLDEPTSFLDLRHQVLIYDLLKKMQVEDGKTVVAITHDINLAAQYCDEVLLLAGGSGYFRGRPDDIVNPETITQVFGVGGFSGTVGATRFFLPLGKYARDRRQDTL
ncbi:MAG TPA: ABC transporter ATP-binding protein [Anaerohalosphaeraceae bacterium]|nr:ABC transporter ATP-binding protein [Anaerohalosphaeraceae bacterium]HRT48872.1 ABC transporter ATP-binding protein [Anaerohalosphaeraceae bacterium]HRT84995.1 ABC transporter ATP-binding protein [Anaerohalosphaeraceae bacterium]